MSEIDILFTSSDQRVEEFDFKGRKVQVSIREMGWAERNKVLSSCFSYGSDGNIKFDFDRYNKDMFKRVITKIKVNNEEVPQSEMNDIFFTRLNSTVGNILEKFIPKAFEDSSVGNFFEKGPSSL